MHLCAVLLLSSPPALAADDEEESAISIESVDDIYPHLPKKGRKHWEPGPLVEAIELSKYPFLPRHVYELVDKEVPKEVITPVAAKAQVYYNGNNLVPLQVTAANARMGVPSATRQVGDGTFTEMMTFFEEIAKAIEAEEEKLGKLPPKASGETDEKFDKRERAYDEELARAKGPHEGKIEATTWVVELTASQLEAEGCLRPVARVDLEGVHFYTFRAAIGTKKTVQPVAISGNVDKVQFSAEGSRRFEALGRCGSSGGKVKLTMQRTYDGNWSGTGGF